MSDRKPLIMITGASAGIGQQTARVFFGMRVRIVDDGNGGWKQIDNPDWRMREAATIADLYGDQKKEATA
jgi:NAD(P)-dependent dehydrogenase (short-subunit alcohol dehydrogenase family)